MAEKKEEKVVPITLEEYEKLSPKAQGYASYMFAEWPNSKIPNTCPYKEGTKERSQWDQGAQIACQNAQDMEDD